MALLPQVFPESEPDQNGSAGNKSSKDTLEWRLYGPQDKVPYYTLRNKLTFEQRRAIYLIASGDSETKAAATLQLTANTLQRWRKSGPAHPYFKVLARDLADFTGRRLCRDCFRIRSKNEFNRDRVKIGGRASQCKSCLRQERAEQRGTVSENRTRTVRLTYAERLRALFTGQVRLKY